jgi:hypothetical protein
MLAGLADRFLPRRRTGSDSVMPPCGTVASASSESVARKSDTWLEHHTVEEHAALLLQWIQDNIEQGHGLLFHEALQEFYSEAVIDAGWAAKPWNPVARQLDLICTGGRKPYVWVMSPTGRMRRRRYYPIPKTAELRCVA